MPRRDAEHEAVTPLPSRLNTRSISKEARFRGRRVQRSRFVLVVVGALIVLNSLNLQGVDDVSETVSSLRFGTSRTLPRVSNDKTAPRCTDRPT